MDSEVTFYIYEIKEKEVENEEKSILTDEDVRRILQDEFLALRGMDPKRTSRFF